LCDIASKCESKRRRAGSLGMNNEDYVCKGGEEKKMKKWKKFSDVKQTKLCVCVWEYFYLWYYAINGI
jgi:hypothetical protein